MKLTLAAALSGAVAAYEILLTQRDQIDPSESSDNLLVFFQKFPVQIAVLASQCVWTSLTEAAFEKDSTLKLQVVANALSSLLQIISKLVLQNLEISVRAGLEALIGEVIHQRNVTLKLVRVGSQSKHDFSWKYYMRFYHDKSTSDSVENVVVSTADANIVYGYEYLGVIDRLVQTPLTDRTYLTLTQALKQKLGGSPFGPAGTGMHNLYRIRVLRTHPYKQVF